MLGADSDRVFTGSIPEVYERCMVPLIFEPYAVDLCARTARVRPSRVLEMAAGTGVVTRRLARALPMGATIVATDLNQAMLDHAASLGTHRPVHWQIADAQRLPFDDHAFDAVVCQFGFMFFPDKARAFAEARRVLQAGGSLIFNVWDQIEHNELAGTVTDALALLFADDPPRFMPRTPHGYHEMATIARDMANGGWTTTPRFDTVTDHSRACSAYDAAFAYCQGTPLRSEIESRGPGRLQEVTGRVADAISGRWGGGAVDAKMQAHVVTAMR